VIPRRILSPLVRSALLAATVTCALPGPTFADPLPAPDYPPTYSSRKAPWYDPLGWFTSTDKKSATTAHPTAIKPVAASVMSDPPGIISTPAWKWYGYGTPTPGQNPLAPNGRYSGVPGNFYGSSGTTPGAVPHGLAVPGVVPDPVPGLSGRPSFGSELTIPIIPPKGPELPNVATRTPLAPAADVDWQSSPARLGSPAIESFASEDSRPSASLKPPVPVDDTAIPVATPTSSEAPAAPPPAIRRPGDQSKSPDLPVDPAADIVPPPMGGTVSKAITPVIARALAPESEVPTAIMLAIRRACGTDVRVMEVTRAGSKGLLVRLSATSDAALAARNRLARETALRGWRIEFELVTPLGR